MSASISFPAQLDPQQQLLRFVHLNNEELQQAAFHDNRLTNGKQMAGTQSLQQPAIAASNPIHFIFHTAFGGSTFLARCLGFEQHFLSIREPNILMDLANLPRMQHEICTQPNWQEWIKHSLRSFQNLATRPDQPLVFKPTNACNNLLKEMMTVAPQAKAVLMYNELEDFLISVLKKGQEGRLFVRTLYNVFSLQAGPYMSQDYRQVNTLTDLQVATFVWAWQIAQFHQLQQRVPAGRLYKINSRDWLADIPGQLSKISAFLDNDFTAAQIERMQTAGVFSTHAKHQGQNYGVDQRQQENQALKQTYARDLQETLNWAASMKMPPLP